MQGPKRICPPNHRKSWNLKQSPCFQGWQCNLLWYIRIKGLGAFTRVPIRGILKV